MPNYESVNNIVQEPSKIALDEDFVAIAVSLNSKGEASHCGLAINHNKTIKLFHFDFDDEIKMEKISEAKSTYFLNKIPIIRKEEVQAFLTKCELIFEKEPELKFGFFYDGELFDENNNLIHKIEKNDVTNCVFFCISVISGFLIGDIYFTFKDWNQDNLSMNWYNNWSLKSARKNFTAQQLKDLMTIIRRIPPHDYFSSGEIKDLPITKAAVLEYTEFVRQIFQERFKKPDQELRKTLT